MKLDRAGVQAWLVAYGSAWERKEPAEFAELFTKDVRYYWTPFDRPNEGRDRVRKAVEAAISRQENIEFAAEVLAVTSDTALAHWSCSFDRISTGRRVHLDGIFSMEFSDEGLCRAFREWWHSDEGKEV